MDCRPPLRWAVNYLGRIFAFPHVLSDQEKYISRLDPPSSSHQEPWVLIATTRSHQVRSTGRAGSVGGNILILLGRQLFQAGLHCQHSRPGPPSHSDISTLATATIATLATVRSSGVAKVAGVAGRSCSWLKSRFRSSGGNDSQAILLHFRFIRIIFLLLSICSNRFLLVCCISAILSMDD